MNEERRIRRARTFDEDAELYDRARGSYPEELFDDLFALAEIAPADAEVLEIGCGTGQATLPLARSGCRVVCVEMGANLAHIARRKLNRFPRVTVETASFEDWDPRGATFNMVFAATSWHWVDLRVRYAKAASVLRPGGVLAFTTGSHAFPPGFDPFFTEIQRAYEAIGEDTIASPPPTPDKIADARDEIEQSGMFEHTRVARYLWTSDFTADEYVELMSTASDHRLMEPAKRKWLFSEMRRLINARPGGRIRKHNLTILHVARRKG
jgi:SAM-dependent methyltransferase